jgi:hypothetical protein
VRDVTDRTDAELIAAAESDAAAFGELYRRHVSTVHACPAADSTGRPTT